VKKNRTKEILQDYHAVKDASIREDSNAITCPCCNLKKNKSSQSILTAESYIYGLYISTGGKNAVISLYAENEMPGMQLYLG